MNTLPLFADVVKAERPWKVVRRVSKAIYAELQKDGKVAARTRRVIVGLAAYRNRTMAWPTASELAADLFRRGRLERAETRLVAPRLTELLRGKVVTLSDGSKVRRGGGLVTLQPARRCSVTCKSAHPVAIREIGSGQAQEQR